MGDKTISRKSKILSRIPPPRVKRILQTDEEIGKMANPVPAVIARSLEVFVEKLLTKSVDVTHQRMAKTLTPQHIKECVKFESTFQFLLSVVASVPDLGSDGGGQSTNASSSQHGDANTGAAAFQRGTGPKRRGSKHASGESSSSLSQVGPPQKTARRGRASKRSVELEPDLEDLSDGDEGSPEDSIDKAHYQKLAEAKAKAVAKAKQQRWGAQENVYELGPTVADDVPDDPSTS